MKKILVSLFTAFVFILSTNYVMAKPNWVFFNTGDKITIYASEINVWDSVPTDYLCSITATLPVNTNVTIIDVQKDWYKIQWYSSKDKKDKFAWVPALQLQVRSGYWQNENELNEVFNRYSKKYISVLKKYDIYYKKPYSSSNLEKRIKYSTEAFELFLQLTSNIKGNEQALAELYSMRAGNLYVKNECQLAIFNYEKAIKYNKEEPSYHYLKGLVYERMGRYTQAKQSLQVAKTKAVISGNERLCILINEKLNELNELIQKAK